MSFTKATLSCRSKLNMVKKVFDQLDPYHQRLFKESCFGGLMNLPMKVQGLQLVHQIILREVESSTQYEAWFKFGDKRARFGLQEFTLVTGLNAGDLGVETMNPEQKSFLLSRYFKESGGKPDKNILLVAFEKCTQQSHKYKLGLLVCLVWVLLGDEERNIIDPWLFVIVEDVAKFNSYPWGKKSFLCTLKNFRCFPKGKLKQKSLRSYNVSGFPLAITIWALEAIPALREKLGTCTSEKVPRMLKWEIKQSFKAVDIVSVFGLENLEVKSTLEPTVGENGAAFFVEMTNFVEVDDPTVNIGLGDECDVKDNCVDETPEDCEETTKNRTDNSNDYCVQSLMSVFDKKFDEWNDYCVQSLMSVIDKKFDEWNSDVLAIVDKRFGSLKAKIDELSSHVEMIQKREEYNNNGNRVANEEEKSKDANDEHNEPQESKEDDVGGNPSNESIWKISQPVIDSVVKQPQELKDDKCVENSIRRSERKKRAVLMDSGPSKVRKLESGELYNPYNVVNETKIQNLKSWLINADKRHDVKLATGDYVSKNFFNDLLDNKSLSSVHMDIALHHIRKMVQEHVELFDQSPCILDSIFTQYVEGVYRGVQNVLVGTKKPNNSAVELFMRGNQAVNRALRSIVIAGNNASDKPWTSSGILYVPCCISNHWIALRVNLKERNIIIYDSAPKHIRNATLKSSMSSMCFVIPWLVRLFVDDTYETKQFTFHRTRDFCPQQEPGVDCGIMVLKFIVFPLAGMMLELVRPKMTHLWREKLAAEMFSQTFDL